MMAGRPRVASAVLAVPVLIEAHHGRLRGDPAVFEPGSLDRSNEVFPPLKIGRFEHHFVVRDVEMVVQKRDTEAVETVMLCKHGPYLFQALGIAVIDRPDICDVVELAPLHRFENYGTHPNASFPSVEEYAYGTGPPQARGARATLTDFRGVVYPWKQATLAQS